jgi:hypothetical protein
MYAASSLRFGRNHNAGLTLFSILCLFSYVLEAAFFSDSCTDECRPLYARHTHSRPFYVFLYHFEDRRPLTHPVHIKSP